MINKNKVILYLVSFTVFLSLITHLLHRKFNFLESYLSLNHIVALSSNLELLLNVIFVIPITLFIVSCVLYKLNPHHTFIPALNMLILTFGSISIIAGGNGLVEYHFSIFMVIAFLAFYDSIKLIIISTSIFAIHHVAGYFLFPELICGTSEYRFSLLLIHAVYLVFTSGANIFLILYKQRNNKILKAENEKHKENTAKILEKLSFTSDSILYAVKELSVSFDESTKTSKEIASSTIDLSIGANNQLKSAQANDHFIKSMLNNIYIVVDHLKEVTTSSTGTTIEAQKGKKQIEIMNNKMNSIDHSVSEISSLIKKLDEKSKEITSMAYTISQVSEQTKMLSLNASIEAARAGEQGKGFAVVANEIGNLAKQTNSSTKTINNLVNEITNEISLVTKAMETGSLEVKEGITFIQSANQVFDNIYSSSIKVEKQTEDINTLSEILLTDSNSVSTSVEEMTVVADETLNKSEQISASSKQQTSSIQLLEKIVLSLDELAKDLETVVKDTNEIE